MPRPRRAQAGSSGGKTTKATAKATPQHQPRLKLMKRPKPQPPLLVSDSSMAPWGGLDLSESSFPSLSPRRPPSSAPPPPAPHATPASPQRTKKLAKNNSASTVDSDLSTPSPQQGPKDTGRTLRLRRRPPPQHRAPRPPRLPPLRQVSSLSFSRSFTFSFFELPLYQSPHCRAERNKNLLLLIKQVHY